MSVLSFAVFEMLGFVSDHAEEGNRFEELQVAHEGAVRGYDEVGFAESGGFPRPVRPVVNEDGIIGAESFGFPFPVLEQGGGANDEGGLGKSLFFAQSSQQAEGLDGFSQSHLVGEDASESVAKEVKEPGHAGLLIGRGWIRGFCRGSGRGGRIDREAALRFFHWAGGWKRGSASRRKSSTEALEIFHPMAGL